MISVVWKHYGCISQSDVLHVNTGSRIFIEKTSRKKEQIHCDAFSTDVDNQADIHLFRKNIRTISFTSEECIVAPFLVEYSEQVNIPIFTGATSYKMESGRS